ncbi:MAG: hypothetical protein O2779_05240 [Nanoarchaeota archaeon]|nr:hypothetical protein [Nanoarchaeota archaeon]
MSGINASKLQIEDEIVKYNKYVLEKEAYLEKLSERDEIPLEELVDFGGYHPNSPAPEKLSGLKFEPLPEGFYSERLSVGLKEGIHIRPAVDLSEYAQEINPKTELLMRKGKEYIPRDMGHLAKWANVTLFEVLAMGIEADQIVEVAYRHREGITTEANTREISHRIEEIFNTTG